MHSGQGQFSVSIQALCSIFNLFLSIIRLGCDLINFSSSCNSSVLGQWIIKQPGNERKLWWNNLEAGQRQCRCLFCCSWTMSQVVAAACEPPFLQAELFASARGLIQKSCRNLPNLSVLPCYHLTICSHSGIYVWYAQVLLTCTLNLKLINTTLCMSFL